MLMSVEYVSVGSSLFLCSLMYTDYVHHFSLNSSYGPGQQPFCWGPEPFCLMSPQLLWHTHHTPISIYKSLWRHPTAEGTFLLMTPTLFFVNDGLKCISSQYDIFWWGLVDLRKSCLPQINFFMMGSALHETAPWPTEAEWQFANRKTKLSNVIAIFLLAVLLFWSIFYARAYYS